MPVILLPNGTASGGVVLTPTPTATPDLTTAAFTQNVLAAGGVIPNPAQLAILPVLVTAASKEIQRYCNRLFALATYMEIVSPEGGRQDRGEPASAKLSAFPVQKVISVLTNRSTVLTVTNTDSVTNQYATVGFVVAGDVEYLDLSYIGLELTRMTSGVSTTDYVLFANNLTLSTLATAINALGHGWSATIQGTYGPYPSASLVGVREPKDAMEQGACLELFLKPARNYQVEPSTGIMSCFGWDWGGFGGGFGGGWDDAWVGGFGGIDSVFGWSQYQVTYKAGWAKVPENIQQITAEVVKGMYERLNLNGQMKSMDGSSVDSSWSWTARDAITNLPDWARDSLTRYRDWTV